MSSPSNNRSKPRRRAHPRLTTTLPPTRKLWKWTIPVAAAIFSCAGLAGALAVRRARHLPDPVITVNGAAINREMFRSRLSALTNRLSLVSVMVEDEQAAQYARQKGVTPTAAQVEALIGKELSNPDIMRGVSQSGRTVGDLKQDARTRLSRLNLAVKGVTASDDEVQRFYEANTDPKNPKALYFTPETAQVAVITTKTREQADRARADLNRGIPFARAAIMYSADVSKANGGLLPPILRGRDKNPRVAALQQAIFGMKPGETLGPISFAKIWWVVRCLDKKPEVTRNLEDIREECGIMARLAKMKPAEIARVEKDFEEFKQKSKVLAFWPEFQHLASRR